MPVYTALPTEIVEAYRNGVPDAHGHKPERAISTGAGNPCRHCLKYIPDGEEMLVLAHMPFNETQPYAEVGPIFLCADACERGGGQEIPEILTTSPDYLIKGYSSDDRIVYGTGVVSPKHELDQQISKIFTDPNVTYIHVRSSRNNCYQARIDRS